MSSEYRTKLIRRAVDANTSPNVAASPIQARTLHKFFESPQCADIAYLKIIERGEWAVSGLAQPHSNIGPTSLSSMMSTMGANSMDTLKNGLDGSSSGGTISGAALGKIGAFNPTSSRSPGVGDGGDKVLAKCVRLLKTYLLVYYPSDPVLVALDRFCFRMQSIYEDASKSFEYVRALVDAISQSRHNPYHITSTSIPTGSAATSSMGGVSGAASPPPGSNPPQSASSGASDPNQAADGRNGSFSSAGGIATQGTAPVSTTGAGTPGTLVSHVAATNAAAASAQTSSNGSKQHVSGLANATLGPAGAADPERPGASSPPGRRASIALSNAPPGSLAHLAATLMPSEPLTPNFLASRTRLAPSDDVLESLMCSSIFGGRVPKALLDLFAERSSAHSSLGKGSFNANNNNSSASGAMPNTPGSANVANSAGPSSGRVSRSGTDGSVPSASQGGVLASPNNNSSNMSQASSIMGSGGMVVPGSNAAKSSISQHNHATRAFLFSLHDQDLRERIATVSVSKKLEERAMYRSFRRGQPLFQYKHYNEQVKLDLTDSQIDTIVTAMVQSTNHESRLLASKILIKLIMDMYCHDPLEIASAALLSILLEMTLPEQPIDTKIHAFNLIFNLSAHLQMFEDVTFFGQPTSTSLGSVPYADQLKGSTPTIYRIQSELFSIVKELLLILVQQGETSRKLWFSGLSCLLYFMTDTGHIDKDKLQGLDPRVIAAFFKNLDYINDSIWRHLVRILVNRLYLDSPRCGKKSAVPTHDFISQVLLLGQKNGAPEVKDNRDHITPSSNKEGIRFIIELYKRSRSIEARDNLFYVIFDYIHYCYRRMIRSSRDSPKEPTSSVPLSQSRPSKLNPGRHLQQPHHDTGRPGGNGNGNGAGGCAAGSANKTPTAAQFAIVLELLVRIDAPQYFASIFKYPPPNFVNHVLGLISHVASTSQGTEIPNLLAQSDPIVLRRVLKDFASLAELTLRISAPFAEDCVVLLSETSNSELLNDSLKSISALVHGKGASLALAEAHLNPHILQYERLQGAQWMQQLLQLVWNSRFCLADTPPVETKKHALSLNSPSLTLIPSSQSPLQQQGGAQSQQSQNSSSSTSSSSAKKTTKTSTSSTSGTGGTSSSTSATPSRVSTEKERPALGRRQSDAKPPADLSTPSKSSKDSKESKEVKESRESKDVSREGRESKDVPKESKPDRESKDGHRSKDHHHRDRESKEHKESSRDHKESSKEQTDKASSSKSKVHPVSLAHLTSTSPSVDAPLPSHMLPTRGLHLRSADASFVDAVENAFFAFVKSNDPLVRRSYLKMVEAGMYYILSLSDQGSASTMHHKNTSSSSTPLGNSVGGAAAPLSPTSNVSAGSGRSPRNTGTLLLDAEVLTRKCSELLNTSLMHLITVGQEANEANLQLMFDIIIQFVVFVPSPMRADSYRSKMLRTSASLLMTPRSGAGGPSSPNAHLSPSTNPNNHGTVPSMSGGGGGNVEDPNFTGGTRTTRVGSVAVSTPSKEKLGAGSITAGNAGTMVSPRLSLALPSASPGNSATVGASPHPPLLRTPRGSSADNVLVSLQYNLSDSDESFGSDDLSFGGGGSSNFGASNSGFGLNGLPIGGANAGVSMPDMMISPPSPQLERLGHAHGSPESSSRAIDMVDLNNQDDSPAGLFMSGKTDVVRPLLELIHIDILLHLFTNLPPRMNSATRPVVLHFLTERCKRSRVDLETVGGSSFFKKLLTENDPLISYLASRFLIDKLQKEQPENFNMVVNTLLAKAVDLNDEKLVSNPYLQIKAIFEMNTTLRRKEHGAIFPL